MHKYILMKLSKKLTDDLRMLFAEAVDTSPTAGKPLKSVLLVGAQLDKGQLYRADENYCRLAGEALHRYGLALDPQFDASYVNLTQTGEDFLDGAHKAELLVFCYLFDPAPKHRSQFNARSGNCALSPHHFEPGIWQAKALAAGAKAIVTLGAKVSVSLDRGKFAGPDYIPQTPDPEAFVQLLLRRDLAAAGGQTLSL